MKEKILILGSGRQGLTAAEFIKESGYDVILADVSSSNLNAAKERGFPAIKADLSNADVYKKLLNQCDIAVSALPAKLGRLAQAQAILYGKNIIDVSYSENDPYELDNDARKGNVFIIPDAGIAPGTSNLLAGHIYSELSDRDIIQIFVGGMQERNIPPLGYALTWSPEDLIAEYTRPARIRQDGKEIEIEALSGLEDFSWDNMEPLESFYTDGLRTLLKTMPDVVNLEEKTVRYKGHTDKILFLRQMGYLKENCCGISPMNTTLHLLSHIDRQDTFDVLLMRISGIGTVNGNKTYISYDVFDKGNNEHSAMERTTGYSLGMFACLGAELGADFKGIIAPEILGMDEFAFPRAIELLESAGISIKRTKTIL